MSSITIGPYSEARGTVDVPGSKSLSNRVLLLAALCEASTSISNLLVGRDTERMIDALGRLGVDVRDSAYGTSHVVEGGRWGRWPPSRAISLDLGNAGTAFRPLVAALSFTPGVYQLSGDPRMHQRPVGDLVNTLRQLGANITYLGNPGYPPVRIEGTEIEGGRASIRGDISSQFVTAILLAAPLAKGRIVIDVTGELASKPYVDLTITTLNAFGVEVHKEDYRRFEVAGSRRYVSPGTYAVEPDASSATYFLAAGAIAGEVTVLGLGRNCTQGDAAFAEVLRAMGADVDVSETLTTVRRRSLTAVDMDLNHIPDAAMTVAATALFAHGTTKIRNVYNWRVKETDRLDAMERELRKLGATVVATRDSIEITPPERLVSAAVDTYDDHRMAMSLALAAFGTAVTVNDPGCTAKTFPHFFDRLAAIVS